MKDTWMKRLRDLLSTHNMVENRDNISDVDLPLATHNCIIKAEEKLNDEEGFFNEFISLIEEAAENKYNLFDIDAYHEQLQIDREKCFRSLNELSGGILDFSDDASGVLSTAFGSPEIDLSNKTKH